MQLNPRYGTDPLITLDGDPASILAPTVRQHRRLAKVMEGLSAEQWATQSRCDEWTVQEVLVHLTGTNAFWTMSVAAGVKGEPSRFLTTFDPVVTPAQIVASTPEASPEESLEGFVRSVEGFDSVLESLDESDWLKLAESPPGHVSIATVAHHALWDSWVHERDIMLPLGLTPAEEPDEIAACLRYVAAIGPSFAISAGNGISGEYAVVATDPDVRAVVEASNSVHVREGSSDAELQLVGRAVDLIDALSIRSRLSQDVPADSSWMLRGLQEVFDNEVDQRECI
ncbi:MAG: maleylpyruvate isomerase family protein [Actinobacteria bacterium]|nr:maleylpyruvate isomerase family protein [Actinomycetota bacterium]